jgi:hypothetical protein
LAMNLQNCLRFIGTSHLRMKTDLF